MKAQADIDKIRAAIEQVKTDLSDLQAYLPLWDSGSTSGAKTYRPIARRIIASAKRLKELVHENTYSYP